MFNNFIILFFNCIFKVIMELLKDTTQVLKFTYISIFIIIIIFFILA